MTKNKTKVIKLGKWKLRLYLHASLEKKPAKSPLIRKTLEEILRGFDLVPNRK